MNGIDLATILVEFVVGMCEGPCIAATPPPQEVVVPAGVCAWDSMGNPITCAEQDAQQAAKLAQEAEQHAPRDFKPCTYDSATNTIICKE